MAGDTHDRGIVAGGTPFAMELRARLAKLQSSGITQAAVAEKARVSEGQLSRLKSGARAPTPEIARALDRALNAGGTLAALAGLTAEGRPAQLPATVTPWVGREDTLQQMDQASAPLPGRPAVIALHGPAGVGKTALALRWAWSRSQDFPDGQLYVDLHGYSAARSPREVRDVLGGLLVALGLGADQIPAEVDQRAACYRSLLHGQRVLVVLDNATSAEQVRPLLPGAGGSGCVVVVTSRTAMAAVAVHHDVHLIGVQPLGGHDAEDLLCQLLGDEQPAEPVARIARACEGMPLAIRIAAQRARARRQHSASVLAHDIETRGALDCLVVDTTTSVRAALSWSYQRLSPPAARLFRLLGRHPGNRISTTAAAALAHLPEPQTLMLLDELGREHLLEDAGDHIHLSVLVHQYAAELSTGEDAPEQRQDPQQQNPSSYAACSRASPAPAGSTSEPEPSARRHEHPSTPGGGDSPASSVRSPSALPTRCTDLPHEPMMPRIPGRQAYSIAPSCVDGGGNVCSQDPWMHCGDTVVGARGAEIASRLELIPGCSWHLPDRPGKHPAFPLIARSFHDWKRRSLDFRPVVDDSEATSVEGLRRCPLALHIGKDIGREGGGVRRHRRTHGLRAPPRHAQERAAMGLGVPWQRHVRLRSGQHPRTRLLHLAMRGPGHSVVSISNRGYARGPPPPHRTGGAAQGGQRRHGRQALHQGQCGRTGHDAPWATGSTTSSASAPRSG